MHGCCTGCRRQSAAFNSFDIVVLNQHGSGSLLPWMSQYHHQSVYDSRNFLKIWTGLRPGKEQFLGRTVLDIHYKIRTEIRRLSNYFTTTVNVIQLFEHIFGIFQGKCDSVWQGSALGILRPDGLSVLMTAKVAF